MTQKQTPSWAAGPRPQVQRTVIFVTAISVVLGALCVHCCSWRSRESDGSIELGAPSDGSFAIDIGARAVKVFVLLSDIYEENFTVRERREVSLCSCEYARGIGVLAVVLLVGFRLLIQAIGARLVGFSVRILSSSVRAGTMLSWDPEMAPPRRNMPPNHEAQCSSAGRAIHLDDAEVAMPTVDWQRSTRHWRTQRSVEIGSSGMPGQGLPIASWSTSIGDDADTWEDRPSHGCARLSEG